MRYFKHWVGTFALIAVGLLLGGCQTTQAGPKPIGATYSYKQDPAQLTHAEIWPVNPTGANAVEPATGATGLVKADPELTLPVFSARAVVPGWHGAGPSPLFDSVRATVRSLRDWPH